MSNFMGVNPDGSIAWVERFRVNNFVGKIEEALPGAVPGMVRTATGVEPAPPTLAEEERWVEEQMLVADRGVNLHLDGDYRATSTQLAWQQYRCALRDYIICGQITGERPIEPV